MTYDASEMAANQSSAGTLTPTVNASVKQKKRSRGNLDPDAVLRAWGDR